MMLKLLLVVDLVGKINIINYSSIYMSDISSQYLTECCTIINVTIVSYDVLYEKTQYLL